MRIKLASVIVLLLLVGCASNEPKNNQFYFCAVMYSFQVSPEGDLEKFIFTPPHKCGGDLPDVTPSDAWKKTACGYFTTQTPRPTYKDGEEPKLMYSYYLMNPNRPGVVFPSRESGKSPEHPVIYVRDEILSSNPEANDVCDIAAKS
jgi:hypothetical protein